MRGGQRTPHSEDEEESAFISMTDMTVGFLFVIMILLAFFATQIAPKDTVPRDEYDKIANALREREKQVASLLSELEWYRGTGDQSIASLLRERGELLQKLEAQQDELLAIRNALNLGLAADIANEIKQLRDENSRLHRL